MTNTTRHQDRSMIQMKTIEARQREASRIAWEKAKAEQEARDAVQYRDNHEEF